MKDALKSIRLDDRLIKRLRPVMHKKGLNFSRTVSEALEQYVRAEEFSAVVEEAAGAWSDKNHPESTDAYIRKARKGRGV